MKSLINWQVACADTKNLPTPDQCDTWVRCALEQTPIDEPITLRFVDCDESQMLNHRFRDKNKATNVLSFPAFAAPGEIDQALGDLVLCVPVIKKEIMEQDIKPTTYWAYLIIHGVLHLRGFDHKTQAETMRMEHLENTLLNKLGFDLELF